MDDHLLIARFGEMDLVAHPRRRPFRTVMGIGIIRCVDALPCGGQISGLAPLETSCLNMLLVFPHLTQHLDRGQCHKVGKCIRFVYPLQHRLPIFANLGCERVSRHFPFEQPIFFHPMTVAINPLLR